jgi:hypothetical protein
MTNNERCIVISAQNYLSNFRAWSKDAIEVSESLVNFWKNLTLTNPDASTAENLAINVITEFQQYLNTEFKQQFHGKDVRIWNRSELESIDLLAKVFNPKSENVDDVPYIWCYYVYPREVRYNLKDWMPEHLKPNKIYTCVDSGYALFGYNVFKNEHFQG